ncbi:MAG: GFA family protein [Gammaproteobacteria bacterium]|nr:GFA family protein [Gammaproteobacteria bacterium]MCZ6853221.1 GFA family protein [Gammaproteobacteria bacterium]
MIEGGCFCGEIRYQIEDGDYLAVSCHCTMCRRTSGAPYVAWLVVPKIEFSYTSGEPKLLNSSDHGERYFCSSCGTPVTCLVDSQPEFIDVTVGSLDHPETAAPTQEFHTDTRLPWVNQPPG